MARLSKAELEALGRSEEARAAYGRALALAQQEPEGRFLEARLREIERGAAPRHAAT